MRRQVVRVRGLGPDPGGVAVVLLDGDGCQLLDALGHGAGEAVDRRLLAERLAPLRVGPRRSRPRRAGRAAASASAARRTPTGTVTCWSSAKPIRSASGSRAISASASASPVKWSASGTVRSYCRGVIELVAQIEKPDEIVQEADRGRSARRPGSPSSAFTSRSGRSSPSVLQSRLRRTWSPRRPARAPGLRIRQRLELFSCSFGSVRATRATHSSVLLGFHGRCGMSAGM